MNALNQTQIDLLEDFCDSMACEFYRSYSGRGMYGQECIGLSSDENAFNIGLELATFLIEEGTEEATDLLQTLCRSFPRQDSMGRETIYYFPSLFASDLVV